MSTVVKARCETLDDGPYRWMGARKCGSPAIGHVITPTGFKVVCCGRCLRDYEAHNARQDHIKSGRMGNLKEGGRYEIHRWG